MAHALANASKAKQTLKKNPTPAKPSPHIRTNDLAMDSQDSIIHLQYTIGSQGAQRLSRSSIGFHFAKIGIQPKLKVSQPGDVFEQEADRVAENVMRQSSSVHIIPAMSNDEERIDPKYWTYEMNKEEDLKISRKPTTSYVSEIADENTNEIRNVLSSSGSPLDSSTRKFMESKYGGQNFSNVLIHTDKRSVRSANSIDALAYTVGNNVVFGERQYSPHSSEGRRLLAHELTHVIQQSGAGEAQGSDLLVQRDGGKRHTSTLHPEETEIFSDSVSFNENVIDYSIELWNFPSLMMNDPEHRNKTKLMRECQAGVKEALLEISNLFYELPAQLPPLHLFLDAGFNKVMQEGYLKRLVKSDATKEMKRLETQWLTSDTRKSSSKKDPKRYSFPWTGEINTSKAALRKTPQKDFNRHQIELVLPKGTKVWVKDITRNESLLVLVSSQMEGALTGYVSQDLVTFLNPDISTANNPDPMAKIPSLAEAFVVLKKAERRKAGPLTEEDEHLIDLAIVAINKTSKFIVDESTYKVKFAHKEGVKTGIDSIEDFILFVEQVEAKYPQASPKEIASEIRQLWYSDTRWEVLIASEGIVEAGKDIDIKSEPNPIASQFDMKKLRSVGGRKFDTRMGEVDIAHVMAGIDASLSGSPPVYPKSYLDRLGHDDFLGKTEAEYDVLKEVSAGDSRDFATWAGDLGQQYGEYLLERYVKKNTSTSLSKFALKMSPQQSLGDIHGYIALEVYNSTQFIGNSPMGKGGKISDILRTMYLIDKSQLSSGMKYQDYIEKVSGKRGRIQLKAFMFVRSVNFAKIWYADKKPKIASDWLHQSARAVIDPLMKDFEEKHLENEFKAPKADRLSFLVDNFIDSLARRVK